ncbi:hypothetical protein [Winogradskyella sp. SM1960]|uniref:hypothetical protein n=1 Tax=Winogradskyella sp. SM1960 TaxID=2865955 RepID=UPI001CD2038F|nr:hypothetical protein [Winogradskyella sp. SM1960]
MKNVITFIILLFTTLTVSSQIGVSKSEIIKNNQDYVIDVTEDGTEYITYVVEFENYDRRVACYLTNKEVGEAQICYRVAYIEPSSETNNWVRYFNNENFIKLDGMTWKDYEHSVLYDIVVKDGSCLVIKTFDEKR